MPGNATDQEGVRIARNTGYLTAAFIIQKALSFGFFIYYARTLGPADTGKLSAAIAIATLFGILIDLGFSPIIIREISRTRDRAQELLSNVLWIKMFFAILTYLGLVVFVSIFSGRYDPLTRELVYIAGAVTVLESLTLSFYGVLRGFQNLRFEAIGSTLFQIVAVVAGIIAMQITQNVFVPAFALLVGALTNFSFAVVVSRIKYGIHFSLRHSTAALSFLIERLGPFLMAGIFTRIYAYIDVVLLSLIASETAVGWYAAANKILLAIQFIPLAFNNSIYPAMSAYFVTEKARFAVLFDRVIFFLATIAFPLTAGIAVLADQITPILSDAYTESVLPLRIVAFAIFFMFANTIFSSYLNAANAQRYNTINLGIVVVFNILLNLLLVPGYREVGTSIALCASAVLLFILNAISAQRVLPMHRGVLFSGIARTVLASVIMGVAVFLLRDMLSVPVLVLLGVVLYAIFWFLFGGLYARETVRLLRRMFAKTSSV